MYTFMVSIIEVQESQVANLNTQTRLIHKMHFGTEIIVFGTINLQTDQMLFYNMWTECLQFQLLSTDKNSNEFWKKQRIKSEW